jgi:ribosomal protein S18 acetylase RimI-like enzyme
MDIREIGSEEFGLIWPVWHAVVTGGDTYVYSPDTTFDEAKAMWTASRCRLFMASERGQVLGCYLLRPNQVGLGDHVANAGYMVAPNARGKGVARAMCEHSIDIARQAGFAAMQFNFVVSSNTVAVALWQKHGFEIVGRVPKAFRHKTLGPTDVYVMYREL